MSVTITPQDTGGCLWTNQYERVTLSGLTAGGRYSVEWNIVAFNITRWIGTPTVTLHSSEYTADSSGSITINDLDKLIEHYHEQQALKPSDYARYGYFICAYKTQFTITDLDTEESEDMPIQALCYSRKKVTDLNPDDFADTSFQTLNKTPIIHGYHFMMAFEPTVDWITGGTANSVLEYGTAPKLLRVIWKPAPVWKNFVFINNFGFPENLQLVCSTEYSMKTDFDEAISGRTRSRYNIESVKTYTCKTPPMPLRLYEYMEDFLTSPYITICDKATDDTSARAQYLFDSGAHHPIYITSYKWTPTDKPGTQLQLEFSFRFGGTPLALLPELSPQVFRTIYTEEYS